MINVGPAAHTITGSIPRIVFANLVPFEARFDGYTIAVEPDQRVLRAGAREVERTFAEALGPTFLGEEPPRDVVFHQVLHAPSAG